MALVAAACGDDSASDTGSTTPTTAGPGNTAVVSTTAAATTAPSDVDPNGVLKIGLDLTPGTVGLQFDPIKTISPSTPEHLFIYHTLLRAQTDGTYTTGFAKSATVVDPQTIKVELFPNIKFTDGTALDSEAAKFSIERNAASKSAAAFGVELQQLDTVQVDSPTQFTIKLKTPVAGIFYTYLSRGETAIVSPTAVKNGVDLNTKPVGAGPFMLESFTPGASVKLVKNPTFFEASKIRLAGVEYLHVPAAAQATAMKSGNVDAIDNLQTTTAKQIAQPGLTVRTVLSDSVHAWSPLCKKDVPLSDVKVRQALNYAIDRDAINNVVFDGKSEPMWGLFGSKNPYYDASLKDIYKRDVNKAKQLLAEAGYPQGFKMTFLVTPGDSQTISEIVQQQWKDIGVELSLQPSPNIVSDFFTPGKPPAQPGYFFLLQRAGLDKVTRSFMPGGSGNVCDWNDPVVNQLADKIRAVSPTSDDAKTYWKQMQQEIFAQVPNVFTVFGAVSNAYSDRVGNPQFIFSFAGVPFIDAVTVYIKKK